MAKKYRGVNTFRSDLTGSVLCGLRHQGSMTYKSLLSYCICHDPTRVHNAIRKLIASGQVVKTGTTHKVKYKLAEGK